MKAELRIGGLCLLSIFAVGREVLPPYRIVTHMIPTHVFRIYRYCAWLLFQGTSNTEELTGKLEKADPIQIKFFQAEVVKHSALFGSNEIMTRTGKLLLLTLPR
jgi:hypothetical protein